MARLFLIVGGVLAVLGLILWATLPVKLSLPPFVLTALLSLGYGVFSLEKGRPRTLKKRNVSAKGKRA